MSNSVGTYMELSQRSISVSPYLAGTGLKRPLSKHFWESPERENAIHFAEIEKSYCEDKRQKFYDPPLSHTAQEDANAIISGCIKNPQAWKLFVPTNTADLYFRYDRSPMHQEYLKNLGLLPNHTKASAILATKVLFSTSEDPLPSEFWSALARGQSPQDGLLNSIQNEGITSEEFGYWMDAENWDFPTLSAVELTEVVETYRQSHEILSRANGSQNDVLAWASILALGQTKNHRNKPAVYTDEKRITAAHVEQLIGNGMVAYEFNRLVKLGIFLPELLIAISEHTIDDDMAVAIQSTL